MIKNLLAASELTTEQIRALMTTARAFSKPVAAGETVPLLTGKTVVTLFFENSTRTRMSFDLATRRLGGASLAFTAASSSTQKGETLVDTARNIAAMKVHCWVIRHAAAGSPATLQKAVEGPVVNAGDGFHEHPTQALLDAYTLEEKLGDLRGKHVLIVGDIAHSRVARSNIHVLTKLGAKVSVAGPPTMLPAQLAGVERHYRIDEVLPKVDAVMALRIQLERQNKMQIPSLGEYRRFWGIDAARASKLKPGALILHPGPVNRGVELDPDVADGPRSVILDQVANGVLVRMAVLAAVCNPKGLEKWLS